jgi:hypothetical protein
MSEQDEDHIEEYGDAYITSKDAKVPRWLILIFLILPFWGIYTFAVYWNGSEGWLDRGYWHQLQIAANTTFPQINQNEVAPPR